MPSTTRPTPFPRYVFGPKPKRRTELGLLVFGSLLIVALYVIAALGQKSKIPDNLGAFLGIVLGLSLLAHMANRWLAPNANAVILPLAALLNGIGYVVIARWDPGQAQGQAAWAALGILLYILTLLVVRYSRDLERYRYLLLLVAGIFLVAPLFFSPIYGARLWVHFGSLEFQPIEFSKILLCIFFASYFAENKEMLTIPTAQVGNRLYLDPRPLIPILVAWGAAMAVIGLEDDIGFAALLFVLFIGLLWVATGRVGYLVLGLVLFGVGAYIAARYFGQVHLRVEQWQNPWPTATKPGDSQLAQAWYSMGTGGVGGTGLGFDHYAGYIPELTSDMIFAAIGTEMGLVGCVAVVMAFILLVGAGLPGGPDGALGLLAPHGDRADPHPGVPGLLHHGGGGAAVALHRRDAPLRGVRGVVPAGQLRPHRADAAHLRRGRGRPGRDAGRRCGRRTGRAAHGPGALRPDAGLRRRAGAPLQSSPGVDPPATS